MNRVAGTMETALMRLIRLVALWTGIDLDRGGRGDSVERFLHQRVKALGLPSEDAYVSSLGGATHPEVVRLINSVTVGHTWFFRDPEQLTVVSKLFTTAWPPMRRLGVWVAGCATGEDVYTLAMLADRAGRPATILGTDINSEGLVQARAGRYGDWSVRDVPADLRAIYLPQTALGRFEIVPGLRQSVSFQHHNLRDPPPPPPLGSGWDLILCRNVLIYFSTETALGTVAELGKSLSPDGWLLLGASELIHTTPPGLEAVRMADRYAFRRLPAAPARPSARPEPMTLEPQPAETEVRANPDAAISHVERGNIKLEAGNFPGALAEYAKALELDPLSTEARLYTGIAYHMEDDHAAAVQALRAALFLDPDLWPASYYLALSYEKLGRPVEAQREYRRVVNGATSTPALRSRGGILRNLDEWRRDVMMMARKRADPGSGGQRMDNS